MRTKKNLIMLVMVGVMLLMATGYAYFATKLNINATGNITSTWNVYFESINSGIAVGGATNASTPSVSGTSANMNVNLELPGDSMTYSLVLKNGGTVGAIIEDIDAKAEGSTGIIYSISGLNIGDKLSGGASKTITIKIEYDPNTSSQPVETYKKLTVTIDAVQDIGQSITSQTPSIEGEIGTLARAILNSNQVQSDENIDFSKGTSYVSSYKELHEETARSVYMGIDTYYYGSGYTFDNLTGQYTLTGTTTGKWSTMSTNYKNYPYTCRKTNTDGCTILYKMTGYTNTSHGVGYSYKVENIYSKTGKGLYYTSTNTEENKTTYYFRGDVDNNYVTFGKDEIPGVYCEYNGREVFYHDMTGNFYTMKTPTKEQCVSTPICINSADYAYESTDDTYAVGMTETFCVESGGTWTNQYANATDTGLLWRIVRINENGSIRLVANTVVNPEIPAVFGNSNAYVGYMYGDSTSLNYKETHVNNNDSVMKELLDKWYENNLINYASYLDDDAGFCNDRSVASTSNTWISDDTALGYGTNTTFYGAYNRLINLNKPQFACPQKNDLFTSTTSVKGNKKLKYSIGTLTADEATYSGLSALYSYSDNLFGSYLIDIFKESTGTYPPISTMTPSNYRDGEIQMFYYISDSYNYAALDTTYDLYQVAPVINLKSNIGITGGSGTVKDPYVLNIN